MKHFIFIILASVLTVSCVQIVKAANTVVVSIDNTAWVELSSSGASGFLSNGGSCDLMYSEALNQPAAASRTGHILHPKQAVNYTVVPPQKVWGITLRSTCVVQVIVTAD